jgi:cytochrome c biogenesis protein CcdA
VVVAALVEAPLAFAFAAGLVAAVNPCGFAMLPAYLSYFLGVEQRSDDGDGRASLVRALYIGGTVSLGFLAVFGVVGLLVTAGLNEIRDVLPWVTIAIGGALVALGIAMLLGFHLPVALPRIQRGADGRSFGSLVLFGVSYATASLSCALPVFLVAVTGRVDGFVSGVAAFGAYALAMSLVLLALTISLALARRSLVQVLRRAMVHADRIAGGLLVVAGLYTIWYWVTDLTTDPGEEPGAIRAVQRLSGSAQSWVREVGAIRIGVVLALLIAALVAYLALPAVRRRSHSVGVRDGDQPATH